MVPVSVEENENQEPDLKALAISNKEIESKNEICLKVGANYSIEHA